MDYIANELHCLGSHVLCPPCMFGQYEAMTEDGRARGGKNHRMSPSLCVCSLLSPAVTTFLLKFSLLQKSASFHETVSYKAFYTSFWKAPDLGPGYLFPPVISSPLLVITAFRFCLSISISIWFFHSFIVFYSNSPLLKPFFLKDPWWFPVLLARP